MLPYLLELASSAVPIGVTSFNYPVAPTIEPEFNFTHRMLNDPDFDVDQMHGVSTIPTTIAPPPLSLYRRWVDRLLGISAEAEPYAGREYVKGYCDGWIMIEPIKRSDQAFSDIWDPSETGEWVVMPAVAPLPEAESLSSVSFVDPPVLNHSPGALLRWAFASDLPDPLTHELERMSIWSKAMQHLPDPTLPGYLACAGSPIPSSFMDIIDRDVRRTKPASLRPRMTRILEAYVARNPRIGFCQGMSYLVSALLQQTWLSDEQVFNALAAYVEGVNDGYYDDALSGVHADIRRMQVFLTKHSPTPHPLPLVLMLVEPMIAGFTRSMPVSESVRMFDIAFSHGRVGMFAIYLAMVDLTRPAVEKVVTEHPGEEICQGLVAYRAALSELNHLSPILRRAEAYLVTHRAELEELTRLDVPVVDECVPDRPALPSLRPRTRSVRVPEPPGPMEVAKSAVKLFIAFADKAMNS